MAITTHHCDVGDKIRATATFTDPDDGSPITPTTVSFRVVTPAGVGTTYVYGVDEEVTLISTGVYRVLIDLEESGKYKVRVWSTGTGQAAELGTVIVERDPTA